MTEPNLIKRFLWLPLIAIALSVSTVIIIAVMCFVLAAKGSKLSTKVSNIEKNVKSISNNEIPHLIEDVNGLKTFFTNLDHRTTNIESSINKLSQKIQDNFNKLFERLPDPNK